MVVTAHVEGDAGQDAAERFSVEGEGLVVVANAAQFLHVDAAAIVFLRLVVHGAVFRNDLGRVRLHAQQDAGALGDLDFAVLVEGDQLGQGRHAIGRGWCARSGCRPPGFPCCAARCDRAAGTGAAPRSPRLRHYRRRARRSGRMTASASTILVTSGRQAKHVADSDVLGLHARLQGGAAQHFLVEFPGMFRMFGHFDGGDQSVAEPVEPSFQQDRHAVIGQSGEGPLEHPAVQHVGQDRGNDGQQNQPRDARHFAGAHQHRQVVDRQSDPEGRAQPQERQRQPFDPHVHPDAPAQTRQQRQDVGSQFRHVSLCSHRQPSPDVGRASFPGSSVRFHRYCGRPHVFALTPACSGGESAIPGTERRRSAA